MILWAMIVGALIGAASAPYSGFGLILGGFVGALMGTWLQSLLRQEMNRIVDRKYAGLGPVHAAAPEATPTAPPIEVIEEVQVIVLERHESAAASETTFDLPTQTDDRPAPGGELLQRGFGWLMGGNTILRVGLLVLFIGLAFLARLVVHAGLFPIEARLATVGAAGLALLAIGLRQRIARPDFGLHLQGAGVAVLYLTVFAAARIYGLMPPLAAFAFMILFAGLGAALAVMQDSIAMALASFLGGFAVPILLGGHAETPTALFTYMTVLNLAIMGIAWKKSWRALNLLGFFATFVLASLWGFDSYDDRQFWICEIFLAISIAIYLATALLYAHNTPGKLGNFADSTLLFGTAIAGFGIQATLVHDRPYASAWSALVFGATYLALAAWALRKRREGMGLLSECVLAIGVGFVTMAIPLALDAKWTSASWALEGAGAFWVGSRQARWMPRAFGLVLQLLGALVLFSTLRANISSVPLLNDGFIGPLLVAVPLLLTAWWLRGELAHSGSSWALIWQPLERSLGKPWFLFGFLFAALAVLQEVTRELPAVNADDWLQSVLSFGNQALAAMLGLLALMAAADWFGRRRDWPVASWPARLSLPLIFAAFLATLEQGRDVLAWPEIAAYPVALAVHFWMLHRETRAQRWTSAIHSAGIWVLTLMLADCLFHGIDRADLWDTSWAGVVFLIAGTAVLMALTRWAGRAAPLADSAALAWPLSRYAKAYYWRAALPIALATWLGAMTTAWLAEGVADPLPYLPLLNPVDLSVLLALVALALWRQMLVTALHRGPVIDLLRSKAGLALGGILAFVAVNGMWLRFAHHFMGVDWDQAMVGVPAVSTGLSILWTLLAMGLMLFARSRQLRLSWLVGASLLGVVVAKLLLVDMGQAQGFARVIAFIGVGVLMLLIGYFVPLPPKLEKA
jgi:uncharacterized membrane protein